MPLTLPPTTAIRRVAFFALVALLAVVPGQASPGSLFQCLDSFSFRTVPLAESLAVTTPKVRQEEVSSPAWKRRWDEARRAAADGDLTQAADRYRTLLAEKEVAEARWEMITILLALGRGGETIDDVQSLNAEAPDHPGYLRALAAANLALGRYRAAAEAFRRLLVVQPDNDDALAGLIHSLLAAEDRREAVTALSVLQQRLPHRVDLREALATLLFELQDYATAWPHLAELCTAAQPSPGMVRMAAKVSDALHSHEEAAGHWRRYAELRPDDLEARQWLAEYYTRSGKAAQALPHLEAIRQGRFDDPSVLKRIGLGYLGGHDYAKAAVALEEYSQRHPEDREAARSLVAARLGVGSTAESLRALERYFAVEPQPEQAILETALRLYEDVNAHDQAVAICRRLQVTRPDDPVIAAALSKHLEVSGRDEEALTVWRQRATRLPAQAEAWRRLAVLLERLGRTSELYEVLATLHQLEPADNELSMRLLRHYAGNGDVAQGMAVASDMARTGGVLPGEFYQLRAELGMRRRDYQAALQDAEQFLGRNSAVQPAVRSLVIRAAGRLGDVARVRAHHQGLVAGGEGQSAGQLLLIAQAYADCGSEDEARTLLQEVAAGQGGGSAEDRVQAYALLSESFSREHRPYEAEESLRVGLVGSGDGRFFLPRLVELALAQGQVAEASAWLVALRPLMGAAPRRLALLEAKVLMAQGELRKARAVVGEVEADLAGHEKAADAVSTAEQVADRLQVAALWGKAEKPRMALSQCRQVLALDPDNLEARVIMEKIGSGLKQASAAIDLTGLRFDQLCDLAEVYSRHGMPEPMAQAASQALRQRPDSLRAGLLLADALAAQGQIDAARSQLEQTSAVNPENFFLKVRAAALGLMRGDTVGIEALADSPESATRPDVQLLQARALWRKNHWTEALQRYGDFLTPRVAGRLRSAGEEYGTSFPGCSRQRTVWEVLTRDPGPDADLEFADQVMAPATTLSLLEQGAERVALAVARQVSSYRWQQQVALEYAPRQAVVRHEYTIAQKQYQALLRRYPQERQLLFDLAGMDSVLGNLGEEAAAYSSLRAAGIEFPELDEALARNQLKQRPRLRAIAGYQREAGRNGYIDRDKEWQGASFWNSFKPLHDGEFTVERIRYRAGNSPAVVPATRAVGSYSASLLSGLAVRGKVGVQEQERTDTQGLIANAAVVGRVGDGLTGTLSYDRDVVEDTVASLERNIFKQDLQGGIVLEPMPRLAVGGGYLVRDYSDNNWTTGYDVWGSYLILSEPTFLQMKYRYDFEESREGALAGGLVGGDGFAANDHPYWAPKNYWVTQVGLFFKHSLAEEPLGREAPRYYTLEYSLGHDVDGYASQTAKAALFAECTPNFLMEAAVELANSQSFRRQDYRLGVSYRW